MVGVRPGEEVMVGLVVALMFVAWAGLALGQSSIDALLFAQFGVELLPLLYASRCAVGGSFAGGDRSSPADAATVAVPDPPLVLAAFLVLGRFAVSSGAAAVYRALWLLANVALLVQGFTSGG